MDTRVGKLEDEAVKTKERLKALRSRQQDTTDEQVEKSADEPSVLPRSVGRGWRSVVL